MNLYNAHKKPGECLRVFPLSNWSELDIWHYIHQQNLSIVPLYFAAERPVVQRDGNLIMVDDDRMPLNDGEVPMMRSVRFRTLDCYRALRRCHRLSRKFYNPEHQNNKGVWPITIRLR